MFLNVLTYFRHYNCKEMLATNFRAPDHVSEPLCIVRFLDTFIILQAAGVVLNFQRFIPFNVRMYYTP